MSVQRTAVVIDDDMDVGGLIRGTIAKPGLNVYVAETGISGVEAVREHSPDIVVVDFGLPDFSGLEVTQRIRAFSDVPILMLTGHDILSGASAEAGVNEVMAKPFSPPDLREHVDRLLNQHQQGADETPTE